MKSCLFMCLRRRTSQRLSHALSKLLLCHDYVVLVIVVTGLLLTRGNESGGHWFVQVGFVMSTCWTTAMCLLFRRSLISVFSAAAVRIIASKYALVTFIIHRTVHLTTVIFVRVDSIFRVAHFSGLAKHRFVVALLRRF